MQEVVSMCINVQKETNIVVFYLSITYFQFQFLLFACLYSMFDRM